jgi:hypothetical protein
MVVLARLLQPGWSVDPGRRATHPSAPSRREVGADLGVRPIDRPTDRPIDEEFPEFCPNRPLNPATCAVNSSMRAD